MAYLKPKRLKCPKCGFQATIKTVIGVGPGSRRGDVPSKRFHSCVPFVAETSAAGKPTGRLLCPNDATPVWTNMRGYRALGPLTEKEQGNPLMHGWMAPGTAPAKPLKKKWQKAGSRPLPPGKPE